MGVRAGKTGKGGMPWRDWQDLTMATFDMHGQGGIGNRLQGKLQKGIWFCHLPVAVRRLAPRLL